jgi:hypothetical protein
MPYVANRMMLWWDLARPDADGRRSGRRGAPTGEDIFDSCVTDVDVSSIPRSVSPFARGVCRAVTLYGNRHSSRMFHIRNQLLVQRSEAKRADDGDTASRMWRFCVDAAVRATDGAKSDGAPNGVTAVA